MGLCARRSCLARAEGNFERDKMKLFQKKTGDAFGLLHVANGDEVNHVLRGQLRLGAAMVGCIALAEFIMYFIARNEGFLLTSASGYMTRYLLIPSGCNLVLLLLAWIVRRMSSLQVQTYANCIMFVGFCCSACSAHLEFGSLSMCYAIPILMTIVFGDTRLTSCVFALSVISKLFSDFIFAGVQVYCTRTILDWIDVVISLVVLAGIYAFALQAIGVEQIKHRNALNKELERLSLYEESITDPLTGVLNRKGLRRCFNRLMNEKTQDKRTLVMMDLNRFKEINDRHGHLVGDQYLKQFAQLLTEVKEAEVCRYGGDEFCMLMRGYGRDEVLACCQKLQEKFGACELSRRVEVASASFGAADYQPEMPPSELVRRADEALYQAKQAGGHMVFYEAETAEKPKE